MSPTARYVFAVARSLRAEDLADTVGFHDVPLDVVSHRGLSAVVCDVELAEFGEEALTKNLEDLAWLEWAARTHDGVVWRVAGLATCAPLRLVTVCSDDDSVRAKVDALHGDLEAVLDRVEGRKEWSLKVLAPAPVEREPVPAPSGASSGADYLRRKREAAGRRRELGEQALQAAEVLHRVASEHAVASRRLAPQDPRLTGRPEPMVLNGAYLVEADQHESFRAAVAAAAELRDDVSIELEGPWPPYSFAVLS
ncbi:GvpL/GvpF family gas vesicle protein [Nocardioides halotolerans]|uniref:GvpL/GvpF family gas vesicle protein n=1 Tax=Nocardioides halotolerans TaxID=433660 RepID=UPI000409E446|nr:GvpL/GvpF family gas vesicle protein [Nocardioides halotolerans]